MKKEPWISAALTNDALVAELLIRMKQPSTTTTATATSLLPSTTWGNRKLRSKPAAVTIAAAASGFRKEQQSGSPTTPLCWSGGGGASTSDGYDESSRPSDLSSAGRSTKGALGNEGATTSTYKKSRKRKSFAQLKEEEDFLLKERSHLNRELESMRVTMSNQIATSQNLKKFKIDLHQYPKNEIQKISKTVNHGVDTVEPKTDAHETGFVLPDLNMALDEEQEQL